ncbi:hypothetical protein DIJ61_29610 [Burkholderia pseudomallei]|nr:hypothetical protein DIJ61_29610 [Burkholderia pseudomallei]
MSARCATARRARRRIARIADRVSPIGYRASGRGRMRAALPPRVAPYVAVHRRCVLPRIARGGMRRVYRVCHDGRAHVARGYVSGACQVA